MRIETKDYVSKMFDDHGAVSEYHSASGEIFVIKRKSFDDELVVLFDDSYLVTAERIQEIMNNQADVRIVVLSSAWLKYSTEAKVLALSKKLGLFTMSELYGALFREDFWNFEKRKRDDR